MAHIVRRHSNGLMPQIWGNDGSPLQGVLADDQYLYAVAVSHDGSEVAQTPCRSTQGEFVGSMDLALARACILHVGSHSFLNVWAV